MPESVLTSSIFLLFLLLCMMFSLSLEQNGVWKIYFSSTFLRNEKLNYLSYVISRRNICACYLNNRGISRSLIRCTSSFFVVIMCTKTNYIGRNPECLSRSKNSKNIIGCRYKRCYTQVATLFTCNCK